MRFDVNLSVALKGATELGTRAEVKNLNSFRSVERAAEYEFHRQVALLEKGEKIIQETRGWDDTTGVTSSQRSKEDAQDYRYMPDADIPPIVLTEAEIKEMQLSVPELPNAYRTAWATLQLDSSVIESLLSHQKQAVLVKEIQEKAGDSIAKKVAHWFVSAAANDSESISITNYSPDAYIELATMVEKNELSSTAAKEVFAMLIVDNTSARQLAESKNLLQVSDESAVRVVVDEVLADPACAQSVADFKAGQEKAIGFLVGQVMKRSAGKANPALAQTLIRKRIEL
jgi:aspartyl-tRNA(Asn)/glutamyl-tRNA(Gln) amidotransferase subunit B